MKLRLQPIRVFCLHHVTKEFDPETMHECDWMQIDEFKNKVMSLQQSGVKFISLTEAHEKLQHDWFRCNKYAVLTFDDGWASLKEILPWLEEQYIPVTLFLNPAYIKGCERRELGISMNQSELVVFLKSGNIEIASHGWNHALCVERSMREFMESVNHSIEYLSQYDGYIPFYAYPCGRYTQLHDDYLHSYGITPVYCDGLRNYNDMMAIHREFLS